MCLDIKVTGVYSTWAVGRRYGSRSSRRQSTLEHSVDAGSPGRQQAGRHHIGCWNCTLESLDTAHWNCTLDDRVRMRRTTDDGRRTGHVIIEAPH
ncbi:hypothetical protein BofuT4_uP119360.1 [Botrytis cinerea T4]|uniref:Uncharacterized protein n=1 Tax=Botryotinia fuckeliana (strain T4) TaxID=999810 RepID=G2Y071_BOTF4|nr:hypothetical protein BofuT4_uP119360.1 [Botrytis cinerea T4]